jgi:hypothetical protein
MSDSLWLTDSQDAWTRALASYSAVIARQGVPPLPDLDHWVNEELPIALAARHPAHITRDELVRLTEWKMHRGVWRAPNLVRVKSNSEAHVAEVSQQACAAVPHPTKPIASIATLDGVGPATASAAMALVCPAIYPFFDELVASQVAALGPLAWTLGYYAKYAEQLRSRAAELGDGWTPVRVERAVWASLGGKLGAAGAATD